MSRQPAVLEGGEVPSFSDYVASRRKSVTPPAPPASITLLLQDGGPYSLYMRSIVPRRCERISPAAANNNTIMIIDLCIR